MAIGDPAWIKQTEVWRRRFQTLADALSAELADVPHDVLLRAERDGCQSMADDLQAQLDSARASQEGIIHDLTPNDAQVPRESRSQPGAGNEAG